MIKMVKSAPGMKYTLTLIGAEIPKVRGKYEGSSPTQKMYQHCVPVSWVEKGWVREVKEDVD